MRKRKFTEQQSIGFLKQAEAGLAVADICRSGRFADATFYKWRAKFGGMEASDARRLRELEAEIAEWRRDYNEVRPHGSIGRIPPARFAAQHRQHAGDAAHSITPTNDRID